MEPGVGLEIVCLARYSSDPASGLRCYFPADFSGACLEVLGHDDGERPGVRAGW